MTVGGSEAIDLCVRSLINPGDEVLIPEPSFVCYVPITQMAEGVPVTIETKPENGFRLTAQEVEEKITEKTKLLILPYPNNPTGAVMRREDLEAIARVVKEHDLLVLSDEIYAALTYGKEKHVSFASLPGMKERTILVNGFSKAHSMTGWRLGYAAGPKEIIGPMTKLHQFAIMSAPTTSQYAAIEALKNGDEDIEYMRGQYDMRRRLIVDGLNKMGLRCFEPEGAFYVFPSVKSTGLTSQGLLREAAVRQARGPWCPATPSAPAARASCASPTATPWGISPRRWSASRPFWRSCERAGVAGPAAGLRPLPGGENSPGLRHFGRVGRAAARHDRGGKAQPGDELQAGAGHHHPPGLYRRRGQVRKKGRGQGAHRREPRRPLHLRRHQGHTVERCVESCGFSLYTACKSRAVTLPRAQRCRELSVVEPFLDRDYLIDLAKLKTHGMVGFSGAVKNLFGAVPGLQKPELHCRFPEREPFSEMLVDLCDFLRPDLCFLDGVWAMEGNGPTGGPPP